MAAASLIGLGLVALSVSALSSLLLGGALALGRFCLRVRGPWAERRAAALVLLLPPLFGLGVSVTIAVSKLAAFSAGADHCLGHSHHLHLCPIHGAQWASVPWAVAAIACFSTYVLVRVGQSLWVHLSAQLAATRLQRSGIPVVGLNRTYLVPTDERFAFTTGILWPTVIVSHGAWKALDADQRAALIAHEHAHIAHGDIWKRAALGLLTCSGVPLLSYRALKRWELASERICDCDAVGRVGKPSVVASAILSLARPHAKRAAPAAAAFAANCNITDRIQSLFCPAEGGKPAASRLDVVLVVATAVAASACVRFAAPLHHALETILG